MDNVILFDEVILGYRADSTYRDAVVLIKSPRASQHSLDRVAEAQERDSP